MAAKKATKKPTKKRRPAVAVDTPITIGGGGSIIPKVPVPLTIDYDRALWTQTPGRLTLAGGDIRKIIITTGDFELKLPVNGFITIDLRCRKA